MQQRHTVSVNIDDDGAQQASDSFQVTNNVAPTLFLSGAATTPEGSAYTLNITTSTPAPTRSPPTARLATAARRRC